MATLGLHRCTQASHCSGFSGCGPRDLSARASGAVARRLSCSGPQTQLLQGMWDIPQPGIKPGSPALAGGFPTTGLPGSPFGLIFKDTSQGYLLEIRVLRFSEGCFHFEKNFQTPVILRWVQRLVSFWANIFRKCYLTRTPRKLPHLFILTHVSP